MDKQRYISGTTKEVIEGVIKIAEEEMYISKLDFWFFTNDNKATDYISEFNSKLELITANDLKFEISMYQRLYEISEYIFGGEDYNKDNIEKYKIERSLFEDLNIRDANKKAFEILDFLKLEKQNFISAPQQIKKNEFIDIFKNDLGYNLFLDLKENYKNTKNNLANYSFIFYALQKDYLVCSGTKFKDFLLNFDISIDKIDTRQSGSNTKTSLFKSFEDKYLSK